MVNSCKTLCANILYEGIPSQCLLREEKINPKQHGESLAPSHPLHAPSHPLHAPLPHIEGSQLAPELTYWNVGNYYHQLPPHFPQILLLVIKKRKKIYFRFRFSIGKNHTLFVERTQNGRWIFLCMSGIRSVII